MRAFALAAVAVMIAGPVAAQDAVPRLAKATFYSEAHSNLLALGWKPAPLPQSERGCSGGREDVCDKYPEAAACSGTGLALCTFLWRRGETLAEVTTYGEEVDMIRIRSVTCKAGC